MKSVRRPNKSALCFISKAETQSQETPHRWQQPCCHPDKVLITFQLWRSQSDLACVAALPKPASKHGRLLFASCRPSLGRLCLKSCRKLRLKASCSVPGLAVLPSAPAADSCAAPVAVKIHCWNYTFLSGHVCVWQRFVDTTSLTAVHIFTRFTSSTLFPS